MGGWECPHEDKGKCRRQKDRPCKPGSKGCVLDGRYVITRHDANPGSKRHKGKRR